MISKIDSLYSMPLTTMSKRTLQLQDSQSSLTSTRPSVSLVEELTLLYAVRVARATAASQSRACLSMMT